jgi:hypothetical protein
LWEQADQQAINGPALNDFGWLVSNDQISVIWDTPESIPSVRQRGSKNYSQRMQDRMFIKEMQVC